MTSLGPVDRPPNPVRHQPPRTNDPVQIPGSGDFYLLDLGEARLDAPPVGPNQWFGVIQTQVPVVNQPATIDCVYLQPLDEGAGKLIYAGPQAPASSVSSTDGAGSGADASGVGTVVWSNPTGVTPAADYAYADLTVAGAVSHYLKSSGHGFAIPSGATIKGIQVSITKHNQDQHTYDNAVRLVRAGSVGATDRSLTSAWPSTWAATTYGGPTDLWGDTWTYTDINNAGFGAAISAKGPATGSYLSSIDRIDITVYYTLASGFTVAPDAVIAASKLAELRTDGMFRQGAAGTIYAPVSQIVGDLPRIPPSGLESRPVQIFLKASRGEFDNEPDSGIDDISAHIVYRPSYLYAGTA